MTFEKPAEKLSSPRRNEVSDYEIRAVTPRGRRLTQFLQQGLTQLVEVHPGVSPG